MNYPTSDSSLTHQANSKFDGLPLPFDVLQFISRSWIWLLVALISGSLLGLSISYVVGTYTAEYIFFNKVVATLGSTADGDAFFKDDIKNSDIRIGGKNNPKLTPSLIGNVQENQPTKSNSYALDLADWKAIQKSLPGLAYQMLSSGSVPEDQKTLYRELTNETWWQKNVTPSFLAISKLDTKDLAGTIKDLDPDSFVLLSLTLTDSGRSAEIALRNVAAAAVFLRSGGAYIQLRNLLNGYEAETIGTTADIKKKITSLKIEMAYQIERASKLENLRKRFPGNVNQGQFSLDPKDSSAKYLPLNTQVIAVENEISQSQENLRRLNERLKQLELIRIFLSEAKPVANKTFDGLILGDQLLSIVASMQAQVKPSDLSEQEILDQVRAQLLQIQGRFTTSLSPLPFVVKDNMINAMLCGALFTFLVTLLALFGRQSWLMTHRNRAQS